MSSSCTDRVQRCSALARVLELPSFASRRVTMPPAVTARSTLVVSTRTSCHLKVGKLRASGRGASPPQGILTLRTPLIDQSRVRCHMSRKTPHGSEMKALAFGNSSDEFSEQLRLSLKMLRQNRRSPQVNIR